MSANDSGDASASSSSPATAATTAAAAVRRDERQNNAGKTNNNSSNVVAGANALQNVSGTTASTRAGSPSTVAGGSGDARDDRHTRGGAHGKKNAQSISRTSTPGFLQRTPTTLKPLPQSWGRLLMSVHARARQARPLLACKQAPSKTAEPRVLAGRLPLPIPLVRRPLLRLAARTPR